jgi:NPCBM/NEW2 domain/Domain of unknown function (DUF1929)/Glyoxal oxidase N-terminus
VKQPSRTIHSALRGALTASLLVGLPLVGCTDPTGETVNPYSTESHPWASGGSLVKNEIKRGSNALSDLTVVSAKNGWGPIERDTSNGNEASGDGKPITLSGKVYSKGLGVHAPSEMRFDLKGQCMNFSSDIGLDDEIKTQSQYGSVIFKVFVDDVERFNSGVMSAGQVKPVDLKLEGAKSLRLVVENGGEDNWYDRADWANATLGCMVASAGSSPQGFTPGPEAASKGAFGQVIVWPTIAVHSALLPTGNVMTWFTSDTSGENRDDVNPQLHKSTLAWIWNPSSSTFTPANNSTTDLFCAGAASNFEGKLIVVGGNLGGRFGPKDINTFDASTSQWTKTGTMAQGRWYPTVTALANKELLLIGGNTEGPNIQANTIPEVIQTNGTIRRLTSASTTDGGPGWGLKEDEHYYPWMHVAPDGKVFNSGPHSRMMTLDTAGAGGWSNPTERGDNFYRKYGSSAMYDVGKILVLGGGPSICPANQSCGTESARVINLNAGSQVRAITSMGNKRVHANATVLPDGRVIVIGGTRNGNTDDNSFDESQKVLESELWSPTSETFTPAAVMKTARGYHSSALLLPDGRVLSAGGGGCGGCPESHADAEIYYPPYLFKTDGSGKLVERPVISQIPTSITYNTGFEVSSNDAAIISSAVLMRLGAATHAFDQGQMRVPLSINRRLGGTLSLTAPNNANIAPPGMYMLFIIDAAGVPSVAQILRLQ